MPRISIQLSRWEFLPISLIGLWQFWRGNWIGPQCLQQGLNGASVSLCVDPYWINQWLKNYAGGFSKRGLLGELLRHLFPSGISLALLNLLALALLIATFLIVHTLIRRLTALRTGPALLVSSLILLSCIGKSLAETALDPLQVCLLLLSAILLTPVQSAQRDGLISLVYALSCLIYEGSILLLLPVVLLLMRPSLWRLLPVVYGSVLLLLFQHQDSPQVGVMARDALVAFNPWTHQELRYQDGGGLASSVSFMFNVRQEMTRLLHDTPRDTVSRISRSLAPVIADLVALINLSRMQRPSESRALLHRWLFWVPFALPFVLVTHDWLRYGVILLLVILLTTVAQSEPTPESTMGWRLLGTPPGLRAVALLTLTLAISPLSGDVRKFLPHNYFHISLLLLLVSAVAFWYDHRSMRASGVQ